MIISVEEVKKFITTTESDEVLEEKLLALEASIKRYTNNSFKKVLIENNGEYPPDIKMGVVNMLKWELENRDKVGIASETISRHSVTYFDLGGDNSTIGFPNALVGFLKSYHKARF